MEIVAKLLTDALAKDRFSINACGLNEGFLTERYEIRFSKENRDYKIQIFEAVVEYPGFINYDYEPTELKKISNLITKTIKEANLQIGKFGSSSGRDFYVKINSDEKYYDIYLDSLN